MTWHPTWRPLVAASVALRHLDQGPRHTVDVVRRLLPGPAPATTAARWTGPRGERVVLRPEALAPALRTAAGRPARLGSPSGVTHLVTAALPEVVAGYTVRTHRIAAAQLAAGHRVEVVSRLGFPVTRGHLAAAARVDVDGVTYRRLLATVPLRADRSLARDVALTRAAVERSAPAVLHAHSTHLNAQVALALGDRLGIPVVYEVRGFQEETRRSADPAQAATEHYRLTRAAEAWCARRADVVVTLSVSMRDELAARGVDPDRVHLAPNAVDDAWCSIGADDGAAAADLRRGLGIAPDTLVLGVVGTLNAYEGLDVLLDAVGRLAAEPDGPAVHLVVVGGGPDRARLTRLAAGLPVSLVGPVPPDAVRRWLLAADVSCLPRLDLPVTRLVPPLKPVEAMALGRPVIASDLPPLAGLVRPGETGLLVPPGDPGALADAVRRLAVDRDLRHRLGDAAARHVAATHTWSAVAAGYADLYDRIVHQRQETRT